jgi:hypothetical protein
LGVDHPSVIPLDPSHRRPPNPKLILPYSRHPLPQLNDELSFFTNLCTHRIFKAPMIVAILGFMPALDRRLSIAVKSGAAAKVVPNPAKKPKISDRRRLGMSRLRVSRPGPDRHRARDENCEHQFVASAHLISSLRRV